MWAAGSEVIRWISNASTVDCSHLARQRPLLLPDNAYQSVKSRRPAELTGVPVLPLRGVMLLTPGPYAGCAPKLAPLATQ